jgi:hypothetical protein
MMMAGFTARPQSQSENTPGSNRPRRHPHPHICFDLEDDEEDEEEKTAASRGTTSGCTGTKFPYGRMETVSMRNAAFGVLAALRFRHQTINQIAYSAGLDTAKCKIWQNPARLLTGLTVVFG